MKYERRRNWPNWKMSCIWKTNGVSQDKRSVYATELYLEKRSQNLHQFFFCLLKFILHAAISNILLYIKFANFAWDLQLHIHAYKIKYVN